MPWSNYQEDINSTVILEDQNWDQDDIPYNEPLEFDDWVTYYEPHLSNMWESLTAYMEVSRTRNGIMPYIDFWDFCRFCYNTSDKISVTVL